MTPPAKKDSSFRALRYARDLVGVDLGAHTLKVLQVRLTGSRAAVVAYAQKEVWPKLAEAATDEERLNVYAEALRDLLKSQKFRAKGAAFALSGNSSILRFLKLTKPYKTDPKTGIPEKVAAASPFDPADSAIEFRVLDQDRSFADVMAVVAQRKAIASAIAVLRRARLRPSVVVNEALALETAYDFLHGETSAEPVVLVNVGASTTSVGILEKRALKASRTFNIAGDVFTRAVKREFSVTTEEAEGMKKEYGLFGRRGAPSHRPAEGHQQEAYRIYTETSARVYKALAPSVNDLVAGVQHTIEAFMEKRSPESAPVMKIVLSGGSSALKGFEELLGHETGLQVELFEPLRSAGGKSGRGEPEPAMTAAVVFGLSLSGALRGRAAAPRVNLLPAEAKRAAAVRNTGRLVFIAVAVVALLFGSRFAYDYHMSRMAAREVEIEKVLKEPRPEPPAPPAPPKPKPKPVSPYAYLGRLKASGAFGDVVMLTGPGGEYVVKSGRLYDPNGAPVPNVTAHIGGAGVALSAPGEQHIVPIPK